MSAACPKPRPRGKFATREGAELVARRRRLPIGVVLAPRECDCGWWHLTRQGAEPALVSKEAG